MSSILSLGKCECFFIRACPRQARPITFDYKRLEKAIATRDHSYRLLLWISDAIDRGCIPPSRAANHSGGPEAATHWLRSSYHHIPEKLRPSLSDLDEFAAFFSTYLTSSFDVVEKPGTKGNGPAPGLCRCELCMRIVNAPHLRAKKLYARDKKRADLLMSDYVFRLAGENGFDIEYDFAQKIAIEAKTRRSAAYVTYAYWLIQRLSGESEGPAVLALWRLIAWHPSGGMRKRFQFRVEDVRQAEEQILEAIQKVG